MTDILVDLGANPKVRKLLKMTGVPVSLPQKLVRSSDMWFEQPLRDQSVFVNSASGSLSKFLAACLPACGATIWLHGTDSIPESFAEHGQAHARIVHLLSESTDEKPQALIFDATGLREPKELASMYAFFHQTARSLRPCGRALVLCRPALAIEDPVAAATQRAVEGFVRSLARELGRKGATANLIRVETGAEDRLEPALRFLLSPRSAYISGQPLQISQDVKISSAANNPFPQRRPLENKIALVTGAARGIGKATARALAREGAKVIVMDRPTEDAAASEMAASIQGSVVLCDITANDAVAQIEKHLEEQYAGKLDILVHNAGVTRDKMLVNMKPEIWDTTLQINLMAVIRVNQALQSRLGLGGRIVCLSSIAGIAGNMGQTNYATSKAGIIGYVQALAAKVAKAGIAVNAVAPGFIETRLTEVIPIATREVARRLCNLKQGGLPEDVAEVVTFLCSPGAACMSGQVLRICGGNFIGA